MMSSGFVEAFPEEEEDERQSDPGDLSDTETFNPRSHFVAKSEGPQYQYSVLNLTVPVENSPDLCVPIIVITEIDHQLLVAVPGKFWHRLSKNRLLPAGSLNKAIQAAVWGASLDQREEQFPDSVYLKIWIGLLNPELEVNLSVDHGYDAASAFPSEKGQLGLLPFADALIAIADDKFSFLTAESGEKEPSKDQTNARLARLEEAVIGIKDSVLQLSRATIPPGPSKAASKAPDVTPILKKLARTTPGASKPAAPVASGYPGLDPSVVSSALQAGIEPSQLTALSQFLGSKRPGLADEPKPRSRKVQWNSLGQSDEEEGGELATEPVLDPNADPVQTAILKLTSIAENLTKGRKKTVSLDDWSDDFPTLQDSSSSSSFVGGSSRKHAAVLGSLRKAFKENPAEVYWVMETRMLQDFGSAEIGPGEPTKQGTFRGWAEHRSKIPNINGTVRFIWGLCGALDALKANRPSEAQARLILLLAQVDQVAVDRGQWILASEGALEESPPFSSFARHVPPDFYENQHTKLWPPAWAEAFMHKVRETDEFVERRAKLGRRNALKEGPKEETPAAKPVPKKKQKGGKKGQGKGEEDNPPETGQN